VTVNYNGWDDHKKLFETYKGERLKNFDQGLSALLEDLKTSGLLETPWSSRSVNLAARPRSQGRRPRPLALCHVRAHGRRWHPGGRSWRHRRKGYHASENVYRPEDFAASLYTKMGIDPSQVLEAAGGARCTW